MIVWKIPLNKFLCGKTEGKGQTLVDDALFECFQFNPTEVVPLDQAEFGTVAYGGTNADQLLVAREGGDWKVIGSFIDSTIMVSSSYQRRGLGVALVRRCCEHREDPPEEKEMTEAGLKTLKRVHLAEVVAALKRGAEVPEEVLADYPDLVESSET